MQHEALSFASFWAGGTLPAYEAACLRSFAVRGYKIALYSFEVIRNVPGGVTLKDASEIAPADSLQRFHYKGKPNLAHFSDYFRYLMFRETEYIWVDTDMLLLAPITVALERTLLARESSNSINNAIIRLDNKGPELGRMISETEALMDRDQHWGATGPRLLTKLFRDSPIMRNVFETRLFFPIPHDDFWKPFLPEFREECEAARTGAFTLHLWNNIVSRLGVWKSIAPPAGSFLHHRFEQDGSLGLFSDIYPEGVMRQMIENWRMRKDGGDLGIVNLSRQIVPSMFRTLRHYAGDARIHTLLGGKRASA
jgi:hypothetical protein